MRRIGKWFIISRGEYLDIEKVAARKQSEVEEAHRRKEAAIEESGKLAIQVDQFRDRINELETELSEAALSRDQLSCKLADMTKERDRLTYRLADVQRDRDEWRAEYSNLHKMWTDMRAEKYQQAAERQEAVENLAARGEDYCREWTARRNAEDRCDELEKRAQRDAIYIEQLEGKNRGKVVQLEALNRSLKWRSITLLFMSVVTVVSVAAAYAVMRY